MLKEKTTWVAIIAGAIVIALTVCVFLKILTGLEYQAALVGVSTVTPVILGLLVNDRKKPNA
jgi:uncharacterized membrane protein